MNDLQASLKLLISEDSFASLSKLRKEIEGLDSLIGKTTKFSIKIKSDFDGKGLKSQVENATKSVKIDNSAFKEYQEQLALAKSETILFGREQSQLRGKLEGEKKSIEQVNASLKQFANNSDSAKRATEALIQSENSLNNALKAGKLDQWQYSKALADIRAQKILLDNRMNDVTPIRSMQVNLSSLNSVISQFSPRLAQAISQIQSLHDVGKGFNFKVPPVAQVASKEEVLQSLLKARSSLGGTPEGLKGITPTATVGLGETAAAGAGITEGTSALAGVTSLINPVTAGLALVGGAFVNAGNEAKRTIPTYAELESKLNLLAALNPDLTPKGLEEARNQIQGISLELGKFNTTQISDSIIELTKAGVPIEQAYGLIRTSGKAAIATGEDFNAVTSTLLMTMKSYGIDISENAKVTDILANVANATKADITTLGDALSKSGASAKSMKQPFAEAVAVAGLLIDRGVEADTAGRAYGSMLSRLSGANRTSAAEMKRLGLTFKGPTGDAKNLSSMMEEIALKLKGLNNVDKSTILSKLFGQDFKNQAVILVDQIDRLKELRTEAEKAGGSLEIMFQKTQRGIENANDRLANTKAVADQQIGRGIVSNAGEEGGIRGTADVTEKYIKNGTFDRIGQQVGGLLAPFNALKPVLTETGILFKKFFAESGVAITPLTNLLVGFVRGAIQGFNSFISAVLTVTAPFANLMTVIGQFISSSAPLQATLTAFGAFSGITALVIGFSMTMGALPGLLALASSGFAILTVSAGTFSAVLLANPIGVAIIAVMALGTAILSVSPGLDKLAAQVQEKFAIVTAAMESARQKTSSEAELWKGILTNLAKHQGMTSQQMAAAWEGGMLNWWQKTRIVLGGITSDMSSAFKWIETQISRLFNTFSTLGAMAGMLVKGDVLGALAEGAKGKLKDESKKQRLDRLQTNILNTGMGLGAPSFGKNISAPTKPLAPPNPPRADENSDGKKGKKPKDESGQRRKEIDSEDTLRQKELEKKLSEQIAEIDGRILEIKEKEADREKEINRIKAERQQKDFNLDKADQSLELEKQRIELLAKQGLITEGEKTKRFKSIDDQKVLNNFEREQNAIKEERGILAQKEAENSANAKIRAEEEGKIQAETNIIIEQIASKQLQIAELRSKGLLTADVENKLNSEITALQDKKIKKEDDYNKLKKSNALLANKEKLATDETANNLERRNDKAENTKNFELTKNNIDLESKTIDVNKNIKSALKEGAKSVYSEITSAFEDGKLTLEEAFKLGATIFSQIGNVFKAFNGGGSGSSEGGGLLSGLGSIFSLFKGGSKSGGGNSSRFENTTLASTTGKFGALNSELFSSSGTGAGNGGFLSGIPIIGKFFGGGGDAASGVGGALGGVGGAFSAITSAVSTGFTIVSSVISFFKARADKKAQKAADAFKERTQAEVEKLKKFDDEIEAKETALKVADNALIASTVIGISTRVRAQKAVYDATIKSIKARKAAVNSIIGDFDSLGKKAKGKARDGFNQTLDQLREQTKQLEKQSAEVLRQVDKLYVGLGQSFASFDDQVFFTGINRKYRDLGKAVNDAITAAADSLEGGFNQNGVQVILNDALKGISDEYFKPLDDAIVQATEDRNKLAKDLADQAIADLQGLTSKLSDVLSEFGFQVEESADQKLRRLIKEFQNERKRKQEERIKAELDAEKKLQEAQDSRNQAQITYDSVLGRAQSFNMQRLGEGSEQFYKNLGKENIIMKDVVDNLASKFNTAVQEGVKSNLDYLASKIG